MIEIVPLLKCETAKKVASSTTASPEWVSSVARCQIRALMASFWFCVPPCRQRDDTYMIACALTKMLYSAKLRNFGWNQSNISRLKALAWSHAIAAEEYHGADFCTENLEYSTHLADEIFRHSSPDNYSCELYERAIRGHKQQKKTMQRV